MQTPTGTITEVSDPDLRVVVDRCAIIIEQEGYDAPHILFKTMTGEEHAKTRLTAVEVACRWLEKAGWTKSQTVKKHCQGYYENGKSRAYVTSNILPLQALIVACEEIRDSSEAAP